MSKFFEQAAICKDVRVTAASIHKMISDKAFKMSPKTKRLILGHINTMSERQSQIMSSESMRSVPVKPTLETAPPKPEAETEEPDVAEKEAEADTLPVDTKTKQIVPEKDNDETDDDPPLRSIFKTQKARSRIR